MTELGKTKYHFGNTNPWQSALLGTVSGIAAHKVKVGDEQRKFANDMTLEEFRQSNLMEIEQMKEEGRNKRSEAELLSREKIEGAKLGEVKELSATQQRGLRERVDALIISKRHNELKQFIDTLDMSEAAQSEAYRTALISLGEIEDAEQYGLALAQFLKDEGSILSGQKLKEVDGNNPLKYGTAAEGLAALQDNANRWRHRRQVLHSAIDRSLFRISEAVPQVERASRGEFDGEGGWYEEQAAPVEDAPLLGAAEDVPDEVVVTGQRKQDVFDPAQVQQQQQQQQQSQPATTATGDTASGPAPAPVPQGLLQPQPPTPANMNMLNPMEVWHPDDFMYGPQQGSVGAVVEAPPPPPPETIDDMFN